MTTATLTSSADNNGSRRQCLTPRVRRLPEAIDLRHMFVHVADAAPAKVPAVERGRGLLPRLCFQQFDRFRRAAFSNPSPAAAVLPLMRSTRSASRLFLHSSSAAISVHVTAPFFGTKRRYRAS
jgi:hypothetical protein